MNAYYDYRTKLVNSTNPAERVVFKASPTLTEARTVSYDTVDPVHSPGEIMAYQKTQSRGFDLSSAKLISRTPQEAQQTLKDLWTLRGWTMPRFGTGSTTLSEDQQRRRIGRDLSPVERAQFINGGIDFGIENRGAPPAVLYLTAYSTDTRKTAQNINRVPVVIMNLSINYPEDVDYVYSAYDFIPVPIRMDVTLSLKETHSPKEYEQFNLSQFKAGVLRGF